MATSQVPNGGTLNDFNTMYRVLERGMVLTRFVSSKRTPERRMFQVKLETRQLIWSRGSVMGRPEGVGKFPPLCSTVWQHLCVCVCVFVLTCVVVSVDIHLVPGGGGGGGGGGTPPLRVSRYAPRFCPPFSASGRSFCPQKFDHVYYFIQILLGPISKPHIFSM